MSPINIDASTYRSPNFDTRPGGILALVLHTSEGAFPSDAEWLSSKASGVSAHYIIDPNGTIYQLVDDNKRAWHAGITLYGGVANWNDFSIGIELSFKQGQKQNPAQHTALRALCRDKIAAYHIAHGFVVAHRWIARPAGRKSDPTCYTDAALNAFITALYAPSPPPAPVPTIYRATHTTAIFEAPSPRGPVALVGTAELRQGETVEIDEIRADGWCHAASGVGFIPFGVLEKP